MLLCPVGPITNLRPVQTERIRSSSRSSAGVQLSQPGSGPLGDLEAVEATHAGACLGTALVFWPMCPSQCSSVRVPSSLWSRGLGAVSM